MFKQILLCALFLAGCFSCGLLLGAQAADTNQHRRVALVIGNSSYETAPLRNPKRDAEAITQSLESVGFEVTMKLDRTKFQMEDDIDAVTDGLPGPGGQPGIVDLAGPEGAGDTGPRPVMASVPDSGSGTTVQSSAMEIAPQK